METSSETGIRSATRVIINRDHPEWVEKASGAMTFVKHRFDLDNNIKELVRDMTPNFGYDGFGEIIFNRTYSREKEDGGQEDWADVLIRVTEGTFSIRKDWYLKNHLHWDEPYWQAYAKRFILSMFHMYWLPPGRGLWAMGTPYIYERGSMALYNCASTWICNATLDKDIAWGMDALMNGVGVGYGITDEPEIKVYKPVGTYTWTIPDTREGWVESTRRRIWCYLGPNRPKPLFIYDKIRDAGTKIKGFGGVCSGYLPLKLYHEDIDRFFAYYLGDMPGYDTTLLKADLANGSGCCVVSGNVRRSAEILVGKINNQTFVDLKDYSIYPHRESLGWMSNNSVLLEDDSDFEQMFEIAERVIKNGEPGYINLRNTRKGRIGKKDKVREGWECLPNPCGEIMLAGLLKFDKEGNIVARMDKEVCNLAETAPTRCHYIEQWYEGCEMACFYCSTVSLLPTHSPDTNRVVMRNRKIGVSIVDVTGWIHQCGTNKVIKWLRKGYKIIKRKNLALADEAGVQPSNRLTTMKPGGTVPKLMGRTSSMNYPPFPYLIRRIRVQQNSPIDKILASANIPVEEDRCSLFTNVYEYPIKSEMGEGQRTAEEVTIWQQASLLTMLQREWADNAVSNTLLFRPKWKLIKEVNVSCEHCGFIVQAEYLSEQQMRDYPCPKCQIQMHPSMIINQKMEELGLMPEAREVNDGDYKVLVVRKSGLPRYIRVYEYDPTHEEDSIEPVLSAIAPVTKSVALLPHSAKGAYPQMPEEGITEQEYLQRKAQLKPINWKLFKGSDGIDERYCEGPSCELPGIVKQISLIDNETLASETRVGS